MDDYIRLHVWEGASTKDEVVIEFVRAKDNKYLGYCAVKREDAVEFCEQFIYFLIQMKEL